MMLYRGTQAIVRSPDGDTTPFSISAGVLKGDTLAPFLFILCLDYVLRTSIDLHKELGFTLTKSRSRRHPAITLTDADYADDIALFADNPEDAEKLLHLLEISAANIGLHVNSKKTEFMTLNTDGTIKTINQTPLKKVQEFNYLGSNIASSEKDADVRIAKGWAALDKLKIIWKSNLSDNTKRDFFRATVESVLIYGAPTWTLTKALLSRLDGTYTRMLRVVLDISWREHPTRQRLYGKLPLLSNTIVNSRMRFAGHCFRSQDELVSQLLTWQPTHGKSNVGRPHKTYPQQLVEDVGCHNINELKTLMLDRDEWRERTRLVRVINPIV